MSVGVVNKQTGERIPTAGMPAIDSVLSGSSTNPVQNRVVKAALDEKADTDIVASDFDATASYTAGNYCIYEGKFYKFKNNHTGAWSAADVDEIQIAGELASLKSGLTDVNSKITGYYAAHVKSVTKELTVSNDVNHVINFGIYTPNIIIGAITSGHIICPNGTYDSEWLGIVLGYDGVKVTSGTFNVTIFYLEP